MSLFWLALSFLTTIPSKQIPYIDGGLGRSAIFFPFIGCVVGGIVLSAAGGMTLLLPIPLAAALSLLIWIALTGALHLDGLGDCCDGLLGAAPIEKRLEILKDPRSGSFGVIGLALCLTIKGIAIYLLLDQGDLLMKWLPFLLAPAFARYLILPTAMQPQARPGGMGASFAQSLSPRIFGVAAIFPIGLLIIGHGELLQALISIVLASIGALWWITLARLRINGVTGDLYGAVVETAEVLILIGFLIKLPL